MKAIEKIKNFYIIGATNALIITVIILSYFNSIGKLEEIGVKIELNKENSMSYLLSFVLGFGLFSIDKISLKLENILIKRFPKNSERENFFYKYGFKNMLQIYSSFYFLIGMLFFSFWEELVFRGAGIYLFMLLKFSKISGIIITAFLFGMFHFFISRASVLPKFLGGILLGILFIYTGNLFCPFISHAIWNIFIWIEWRKAYLLNIKYCDKIQK